MKIRVKVGTAPFVMLAAASLVALVVACSGATDSGLFSEEGLQSSSGTASGDPGSSGSVGTTSGDPGSSGTVGMSSGLPGVSSGAPGTTSSSSSSSSSSSTSSSSSSSSGDVRDAGNDSGGNTGKIAPGGNTTSISCGGTSCAIATSRCCVTHSGAATSAVCNNNACAATEADLKCGFGGNCVAGELCCLTVGNLPGNQGNELDAQCRTAQAGSGLCPNARKIMCDPAATESKCPLSMTCKPITNMNWSLPNTFGTCEF